MRLEMEVGKTYYIKRLNIAGEITPPEKCTLIALHDDSTCFIEDNNGDIYLFRQDMLSDNPDAVYGKLEIRKGI